MTASCSHHPQLQLQLGLTAGQLALWGAGSGELLCIDQRVTTASHYRWSVVSAPQQPGDTPPDPAGYRGRRSCCHHPAVRTGLQWHSNETTRCKWPQSSVNSDNISIFSCYMALPLKGVHKDIVFLFCFVIEVQCIWVCGSVWRVVPRCTSCCASVSVSEKYYP